MACSICKNDLPRHGKHTWCSRCHQIKQAGYRSKYLADPQKRVRNSQASKKWAEANPEQVKQASHECFMKLKREMIAAYGPVCRCCGEPREMFLTLEHVNRDGDAHRKKVGGGANTYRDLKKRGWPQEGYTLLCMNCNWGTRFGGVCPHLQESTVSPTPTFTPTQKWQVHLKLQQGQSEPDYGIRPITRRRNGYPTTIYCEGMAEALDLCVSLRVEGYTADVEFGTMLVETGV